jgi:hypothetical protein
MSSESNSLASLLSAQINVFKFGGPILIILGIVSCIFNLIIFTKKNLRKNPCSIYLIAFNVSNFLQICTSILITTLLDGYRIDPSLYNLNFCHFRFYTGLLFDALSPSYLILASIDRILLTSPNALTRGRSNPRLAYICLIVVTLFWLLGHSHALVLTNIIQSPNFIHCYFQLGIYLVLVGYYSVIIKGIVIPLVMIILGVWTVKNIRKVGRVALAPAFSTNRTTVTGLFRSAHSKDRQLIQILLVDISVYIIFSLMISIVLMYQQLTQYQLKSSVQDQIDALLLVVALYWVLYKFIGVQNVSTRNQKCNHMQITFLPSLTQINQDIKVTI